MNIYYKQSDITALLSELMLSPWALEGDGTRAAGIQEALHLIQDMINGEVPDYMKIPAADVKLVARGKWKDAVQGAHDSPHVRCSICGEYFWRYFRDFDFCPNCGADMREGE